MKTQGRVFRLRKHPKWGPNSPFGDSILNRADADGSGQKLLGRLKQDRAVRDLGERVHADGLSMNGTRFMASIGSRCRRLEQTRCFEVTDTWRARQRDSQNRNKESNTLILALILL